MKQYNTYIFDLDGTLADTSPGVFTGIRGALETLGEPPLPEAELNRFIGPPLYLSFQEVCGMDHDRALEAVMAFRAYYKTVGIYRCSVYEGMEELLRTLKAEGNTLMVATLKPEDQAHTFIKHLGWWELFSAVVGLDEEHKRTKREAIDLAMERSGVTDYETALMIGDSEYDAEGAELAGVDFCAAVYGFGLTPEKVAKHPCVFEISTPLELLEKVKR